VRQKISDLQSLYKTACDFLKNTREGIMATDELNGISTVESEILPLLSPDAPTALYLWLLNKSYLVFSCLERINGLCRYWDILDPIMSSRSVTKPLHVCSSLSEDQPWQPDSPEDEDDPSSPASLEETTEANLPSKTLELPQKLSLSPRLPVPTPPPNYQTVKRKPKQNWHPFDPPIISGLPTQEGQHWRPLH
jgi:hypothetical protein